MNEDDRKKALDKWAPILNSMGVTGSKSDWLSQYAEIHSSIDQLDITSNTPVSITSSNPFDTLLPIAMKIAAKTISNDLIFASEEEINAVKSRVQSDNRDGKIDSVIEDKEFTEKKLEDDPEYKELMKKGVTPMSAPTGTVFYLDYKYDDKTDDGNK